MDEKSIDMEGEVGKSTIKLPTVNCALSKLREWLDRKSQRYRRTEAHLAIGSDQYLYTN